MPNTYAYFLVFKVIFFIDISLVAYLDKSGLANKKMSIRSVN
jgi:hypothetical protein